MLLNSTYQLPLYYFHSLEPLHIFLFRDMNLGPSSRCPLDQRLVMLVD